MSKTTTCIPAIMSVNTGINEHTIDKLYNLMHIEQPTLVEEEPIPYWHMGKEISIVDVAVNHSVHQKDRCDLDAIIYEIMPGVNVVYTREDN